MVQFYGDITKVDAEQRMVWGYASTEAVDSDGEVVKRSAIQDALADYMKFANIREMHRPSAVGTAKEASVDDKGLYIAVKVVDDTAWTKVQEGVYKGFSIGGKVLGRDPDARKVITKIGLHEISLVDRPANPQSTFDVWKAVGDEVAVATEADAVDLSGLPDLGAAVCKAALAYFAKRDFSASQRKEDAKSGAAMKDGSFPIHNAEDLHNAIRLAGNAKNPDAARAHIKSRAAALGLSAEIPSTWKAIMTDQAASDADKLAKADEAEALAKAEAEKAIEPAKEAVVETVEKAAEPEKEVVEVAEAVVDPVAKATAAVDALEALAKPDIEKSMYDVAFHAQRLADLARHIESRDPDSIVTDRMKAWSKEGGAILKDMTSEEVARMNAKTAQKAAEVADLAKAKVDGDDALAKAVTEVADLKKSMADFADRTTAAVEALTKRLAEVELQPLPAKTAGPGAGALVALDKSTDAASVASSEAKTGPSEEEIAKALAEMSDDDRMMALTKAALLMPRMLPGIGR